GDPRYVLKRALARAEKMGYDHFYLGPELEFFYFKNDQGTEILDKGGYFDLTTLDVASDLRRETVLALEQMGVRIEYSHHEVAPSQHEVDMRYSDALKMADDVITYRIVVKEIASKFGVYATFMPKPIFGQNGSGMHTHQSLFKGEKNAFYDANAKDFLSDTAHAYIAGLLTHAKEICSIFAQTTNSYKRLVPGYEAPVYIAWSRRNRSALIRVPLYHPGQEKATRCEFRAADPACNPYLTFASMLQAGLDGIEKGYKVPAAMEKNLYHLSDEERKAKGIETLPDNLGQAVSITEKSELVRKTLGEHIFPRFIALKKKEWDNYRIQVPQYELDKYLSIL
ncbi:MAG: glutamine synthetase, partial [Candidatus Omnitrophota bacterium]